MCYPGNNYKTYCYAMSWTQIVYFLIVLIILLIILYAGFNVKKNKKNDQENVHLSDITFFIPCYSEDENEINKTLESISNTCYPFYMKKIFIVVDGIITGKNNQKSTDTYVKDIFNLNETTPLYECCMYIVYRTVYKRINTVIVIKKNNKGKKDSFILLQKLFSHCDGNSYKNECRMFNSIVYGGNIKSDYILLLDCDTEIEKYSVGYLSKFLDTNTHSIGVCGETLISNRSSNILTLSQSFEYWITHKCLKSIECVYSQVLVLSGCFSLYKTEYICNPKVIEKYEIEDVSNIINANITKLGEDRYLTNILTETFPEKTTDYLETAKCSTRCPENLSTLVSQRRRWTNSLLFCNFNLLLKVPKFNKTSKKIIFFMIVFYEITLVVIFPFILLVSYIKLGYFLKSLFLGLDLDIYSIVITSLCSIIPTFLSILFFSFGNVLNSFVFTVTLWLYSILIPFYSFFGCDNVSWGITREVV